MAWLNNRSLPHLTVLLHGLPLQRLQVSPVLIYQSPACLLICTQSLLLCRTSTQSGLLKTYHRTCLCSRVRSQTRQWRPYCRAAACTCAPQHVKGLATTSTKPGLPVSKNEEFCIQNEELCIKTEELCIKNDEFCSRCCSDGCVSNPLNPNHSSIPRAAASASRS